MYFMIGFDGHLLILAMCIFYLAFRFCCIFYILKENKIVCFCFYLMLPLAVVVCPSMLNGQFLYFCIASVILCISLFCKLLLRSKNFAERCMKYRCAHVIAVSYV